jgi:hypothetical protein
VYAEEGWNSQGVRRVKLTAMRALLVGLTLSSLITLAASPRDPFAKAADLEPPTPLPVCNTSLCRHELSDLKLVAIVAQGPESVAMFQTTAGNGLVAKRNAQIGNGGARVTRIDRDCLTISRYVTGANGRVQPVSEQVCITAPEQRWEHDYLTDGPYKIP